MGGIKRAARVTLFLAVLQNIVLGGLALVWSKITLSKVEGGLALVEEKMIALGGESCLLNYFNLHQLPAHPSL